MTGIVNSTGARSGVIGTTVGTPAGGTLVRTSYIAATSNVLQTSAATATIVETTITADSTSDWILATAIFRYQLLGEGASDHIQGKLEIYDTTDSASLAHGVVEINNTQTSDAATNVNKISSYSLQKYFHPTQTGTYTVRIQQTWMGASGGRMQTLSNADSANNNDATTLLLQYISA